MASSNPSNFANLPKDELREIAAKGGHASHGGGGGHHEEVCSFPAIGQTRTFTDSHSSPLATATTTTTAAAMLIATQMAPSPRAPRLLRRLDQRVDMPLTAAAVLTRYIIPQPLSDHC
jgi:hypothetical protein